MVKKLLFVVALLLASHSVNAQQANSRLPQVDPGEVGMRSDLLNLIDHVANEGIKSGNMAGCVVAVGRHGKLAFLRAYGHRQLEPTQVEMTVDTVFDMASITKPVSTASSIMLLWQQGKIKLTDRLSQHIPEFANNGKDDITILQLLTHQAGLIPDNALSDYNDGSQRAFERIFKLKTIETPGERFIYSDVGFILLAELVRRKTGMNIHEFTQQHIFQPLEMKETGYLPNESLQARCATNDQRGGEWVKGVVHDPRALRLDGIAGHAGLFSTAEDIAVYAQMLLNGGEYNGHRIMYPGTIDVMTRGYPVSAGTFGLGWDSQSKYSSNRGVNLSSKAFGHGGFTGTVLWIDPELDMFYMVLSNRLHPDGKGAVNRLAGHIGALAATAISPKPENSETTSEPVLTGLDVLASDNFELLKDQRIGLITNHTGIDRKGRTNIQLMQDSANVDLVALFSPEHGIAGKFDRSVIDDSVDEGTGLQVYSLYGQARRPTAEQLANVDALVFDIQDIGTRYYTYISTMGLAMQAAAEHGKRFYVLDRPNPIGGVEVSGAMVDQDKRSFVAFHDIPVRHGMTVGELALMFKNELELDLDLQVVELQGWQRNQLFDETGLSWVNPSPNMRSLNAAMLYPGVGLLEFTNLSVGRGTDKPFEIVGAPWVDGRALARELNLLQIPGATFIATTFTPNASKFSNESCEGVSISISDRESFDVNRLGVALATTLVKLHPDEWKSDEYIRLLGNEKYLQAIKDQKNISEIVEQQEIDLLPFRLRRERVRIYE